MKKKQTAPRVPHASETLPKTRVSLGLFDGGDPVLSFPEEGIGR